MYVDYYNRTRTHSSLATDAPESRSVQPPTWAGWWRSRAWVGFIKNTCDARPDPIGRISSWEAQPRKTLQPC